MRFQACCEMWNALSVMFEIVHCVFMIASTAPRNPPKRTRSVRMNARPARSEGRISRAHRALVREERAIVHRRRSSTHRAGGAHATSSQDRGDRYATIKGRYAMWVALLLLMQGTQDHQTLGSLRQDPRRLWTQRLCGKVYGTKGSANA